MNRNNLLAGAAGLTVMALLTACSSNTRVNPFLEDWDTPYGIPPFEKIEYADYVPAFKAGIEQLRCKPFSPARSAHRHMMYEAASAIVTAEDNALDLVSLDCDEHCFGVPSQKSPDALT